MSGWVILGLLFAAALAAFRLLGLRGPMFQFAAAALLFGCAGYALQGKPELRGQSAAATSVDPPIPLTRFRHAFFGQFTGAESWIRISEALASRGKTQQAAGALQSAVRQHPADPILWIGLGNALVDHARGLTPAGQYAFERAAELAPGHPAPGFFMGLALARSGEPQRAVAIWQGVLANSPADATWRPLVEDSIAAFKPSSQR
jgi:cytochrome c-type biogenesis protein CcmH